MKMDLDIGDVEELRQRMIDAGELSKLKEFESWLEEGKGGKKP